MSTLTYSLDILKIQRDTEVYRSAVELAQKAPIESNEWTTAMKAIANASRNYIFTQSQLSDFMTLAAKGIEHTNTSSDTIVFKIYRDIIENYDNFSDGLKTNYPRVIVDVISIINRGSRIDPISIEKFYQSRKQQAVMAEEERLEKTSITTTPIAAAAIHKEKLRLSNDEVVERLVHIINRDRKELKKSIERLPYSDLKKLSELSRNYSRLQRYSKLITKDEFKNEVQREFGRELRPYQLARAANSIRRVQIYIENILDNKFVHDASHGINHVKHNLEYGYSLINLIELPRKKRPRTQ